MLYALLMLGVLPLAFLSDGSDVEPENDSEDEVVELPADETDDWLENVFSDTTGDTDSDDSNDVLQPIDEIDIADGDNDDLDPGTILEPIIEDDDLTLSNGEEGEILEPIEEDDLPNSDETIAGTLPFTDGTAEVADFNSHKDILCVYLNNATEVEEGEVEVLPSANGEDSEVFVNGKLAAVLKNVNDATAENIYLMQNLIAA